MTVKRVKHNKIYFWSKLPKPFFVLAPMANVTDSVFRKIIAKYGKPDVTWTEFVSADGLVSAGQKKLLNDLVYSEAERPIVAQLFTSKPEVMRKATTLMTKLGFDGVDINMGCPDRSVEKNGSGAAMMKNPELAIQIIKSARDGAGGMPVSVKTRIGYNKVDLEWIRRLLEQRLPALTVHLRTRKEMSDVPAHWDLMKEIVAMRDRISPETLLIGNGDVTSIEMGRELVEKYGCDGAMIGRGVFGKPWIFSTSNKQQATSKKQVNTSKKQNEKITDEKTPVFRLKVMLEHAKLFEKTFSGIKNFEVMKKHFKAYVNGWEGAKELRVKLMNTENSADVAKIVKVALKDLK